LNLLFSSFLVFLFFPLILSFVVGLFGAVVMDFKFSDVLVLGHHYAPVLLFTVLPLSFCWIRLFLLPSMFAIQYVLSFRPVFAFGP
jgi:hypothetical protein